MCVAAVITVCLLYSAADAFARRIHLHFLGLLLLVMLLLVLLYLSLQHQGKQVAN
jgi:uncharacterized membrane protein YccC